MKSRFLVLVAILGIGAIAAGWIYESRLKPRVDKVELIIPDNIDYYLTNLNYRAMAASGELDYEFKSSRLEHHIRTDVSRIEAPSLRIFRDSDRWQINALSGEFQHRINLLRLQRQVVMQKLGDNPLQLRAESIRFEPDRDLITSEGRIQLHSDSARIEAEQAVLDLDAKVYKLKKARSIYSNDKS